MHVDHKEHGWGAYCHRCGEPGFVFHPAESLRDKLARLKREALKETQATQSLALPSGGNKDPSSWPLAARVWLYKAGLSNSKIQELGFYYHDDTRRVVMPVFNGPDL